MVKDFYFSLDFNGTLEDVDVREGVSEDEVMDILNTLKRKGLMVSEHRTNGDVFIDNGNVTVTYQYFT